MSTPYLAEIRLFSFGFPPKGWALCNGQTLSIQSNAALFSLLGTTYGGNGVNNFNLPDFRGRTPVHWGQSPLSGSTYTIGQIAGLENVQLNTNQLPQHFHQANAQNVHGTSSRPSSKMISQSATGQTAAFSPTISNLVALAPQSIANTGGSAPHSNLQPYTVLSFCIALSGVFPSRN